MENGEEDMVIGGGREGMGGGRLGWGMNGGIGSGCRGGGGCGWEYMGERENGFGGVGLEGGVGF